MCSEELGSMNGSFPSMLVCMPPFNSALPLPLHQFSNGMKFDHDV